MAKWWCVVICPDAHSIPMSQNLYSPCPCASPGASPFPSPGSCADGGGCLERTSLARYGVPEHPPPPDRTNDALPLD